MRVRAKGTRLSIVFTCFPFWGVANSGTSVKIEEVAFLR
jgi:hypothetical protein